MTQNDLDNGSTPDGTPVSPNTGGSQAQNASGGSFDAGKLQATLEKLATKLEEVDARSRSLQGEKDRGVAKTSKELETLKRQFAEIEKLTKGGLGLDEAVEELDFRETVKQLKTQIGQINPVPAQSEGNGQSGAVDTAKVFGELFGADSLKDPALAPLLAKQYRNIEEAQAAAYKYHFEVSRQPNPTTSQSPSLAGTSVKTDVAAKIMRLQELQKRPTLYRDEINRLTKELDAVNWGG
jgi:hypothetical protein